MRKINLQDLFSLLKYDWLKDKDPLKKICFYTKTRTNLNKPESLELFDLSWGMEQPLILKALADRYCCKRMLEIGTGRGTACYMVSLSSSISEIKTIDILRKDEKRKTAIGHRNVYASNLDIYNQIPIETKSKIEMLHRSERNKLKNLDFDLVFIDGDHSNKNIILEDFEISKKQSNENTIFVFDDYDPIKFVVKEVVDQILGKEKYNSYLVSFRGHLFKGREKEQNSGMAILSKLF